MDLWEYSIYAFKQIREVIENERKTDEERAEKEN